VVHFDCLDPNSTFYGAFVQALRQYGYRVQCHFHFGNWYEPVAGTSVDEYLKKRPSALRNTLKRKFRKLEKSGAARFVLSTGRQDLEPAIVAYDQIYQASWKQAEPFPDFTEGLIRAAAKAGSLRIGVLYIREEPAAAQVWITSQGRATIFKLAYDERFKEFSAGSLLTLHMLRYALESDGIEEIDFGRGDDPYKSQWMSCRRERWGIMAFNTRTVRGNLAAGIHLGGGKVKRLGFGMFGFAKKLWQ
jgi:CelD/BcsL family acetyltransferase involved in cellulose biosynthesis